MVHEQKLPDIDDPDTNKDENLSGEILSSKEEVTEKPKSPSETLLAVENALKEGGYLEPGTDQCKVVIDNGENTDNLREILSKDPVGKIIKIQNENYVVACTVDNWIPELAKKILDLLPSSDTQEGTKKGKDVIVAIVVDEKVAKERGLIGEEKKEE